jgi:hypothetical protein
MPDPADFLIDPELYLSDGRVIRSLADAIMLLREHEGRLGSDSRDEVLCRLEGAQTDGERQQAAEAFLAWTTGMDLLIPPPRSGRRSERPRAKS